MIVDLSFKNFYKFYVWRCKALPDFSTLKKSSFFPKKPETKTIRNPQP